MSEPGSFCLADLQESHIDQRARRIPWGERPSPEQRDAIEQLAIRPSPAQMAEPVIPAWVAELPRCHELRVPILWLAALQPEHLPAKLTTLVVDVDLRWTARDGSDAPPWPSALALPNLRRLEFAAWAPIVPRGLRRSHLPALTSFAGTLDAKAELLDLLAGFPSLRELTLIHVANHDVFEDMTGTIERLHLRGGTRRFPLELITNWPSLRELELFSMQGPIDCSVLAELPDLDTLALTHCKQLVELDALLDAPALRRLSVVACGRPFDASLRAAFDAHGFERLEIDRA